MTKFASPIQNLTNCFKIGPLQEIKQLKRDLSELIEYVGGEFAKYEADEEMKQQTSAHLDDGRLHHHHGPTMGQLSHNNQPADAIPW